MDRRRYYRALLSGLRWFGWVAVGYLSTAASLRGQGSPSPTSSVAMPSPAPSAFATPDAANRKRAAERMIERRQRDLAAGEQEAQKHIDQLPPEERESFKRNLKLWRELSPGERDAVRKEADERMHAEIEKSLQQTGLRLDKDQREVFSLRYRQERRKLERELQEKLDAERAHRLPGLVDGLKKEFTDRAAASSPSASAAPSPTAKTTPSVSVPAASPR